MTPSLASLLFNRGVKPRDPRGARADPRYRLINPKRGFRLWLFVVLILAPMVAGACQQDSDCIHGGSCYLARGVNEGACLLAQPNVVRDSERDRGSRPLAKRYGMGYPCQFNVDCLPNYACFKLGAAVDGQCVKR